MKKCSNGPRMTMDAASTSPNVKVHPTRDTIVSDAVASGPLRVAIFRPGAVAMCRCMWEEGLKPEDCDALYVGAPSGDHIATFWGKGYRAISKEATANGPGGLCVYRMPGAKASQSEAPTNDSATQESMSDRLKELNRRNAEHWKRTDE
jgi:hypothetical protein